jgi:hypothetical protein
LFDNFPVWISIQYTLSNLASLISFNEGFINKLVLMLGGF